MINSMEYPSWLVRFPSSPACRPSGNVGKGLNEIQMRRKTAARRRLRISVSVGPALWAQHNPRLAFQRLTRRLPRGASWTATTPYTVMPRAHCRSAHDHRSWQNSHQDLIPIAPWLGHPFDRLLRPKECDQPLRPERMRLGLISAQCRLRSPPRSVWSARMPKSRSTSTGKRPTARTTSMFIAGS